MRAALPIAVFLIVGTLVGWVFFRHTPAWDFYLAALAAIALGSVSVIAHDVIETSTGGKQ